MASVWNLILEALIYFVHNVVDRLLELVLGYIHGPRKSCPPPKNQEQESIISKSAVELAQLIRERKLSSYAVVNAYIDHMKTVNLEINAVVDGPFLEALDEARAVDERLQRNAYTPEDFLSQPFLGVPFTTKDSTAVGGKLQTLGLLSRKFTKATEDAECVSRMKKSGAIIIATSNIPEVNMWTESRNSVIGNTNNPYDLRRSVGGSSGGEACLISACATAFGLGTDIGGSIRIPAFNCGVFGHKPTCNIVNLRGCTFRTGKETDTMCAAGPMARYAADLKPILKVIADPKLEPKLRLNEEVNLKKLKYFYIPCNNMTACSPVNKEAQVAMSKVTRYIEETTGVPVKLATLPNLEISGKLWNYWMTQEPADINVLFGNGVRLNPFVELFKKIIGQSDFTMGAIYVMINKLLPKGNAKELREATKKCKEALEELLGDNGVLLYPSQPRTTPFHYYPLFKFNDFHYFSIFNVLKMPVTQIPLGLDSNGLPLGIQIVSKPMNDRLCLAVAEGMNRDTQVSRWVPPFYVKN